MDVAVSGGLQLTSSPSSLLSLQALLRPCPNDSWFLGGVRERGKLL